MPPEAMVFRETMIAERSMMLPAQELNELNTTTMSSESLAQRGAQLNGVMVQVSGGVIAPQAADVRGMMRQAGGAERIALRDLMESSFMDWKQTAMNEQQQVRPARSSISKSSIRSWKAAPGAPQPEISKSALVRGQGSHASGGARDFKQSERSTTPERSTAASSTSADQPARGERTTTDKPSGEQAAVSTSQAEQTKTSELSTSATMLSTDLITRRAATSESGATIKETISQQPERPRTDAQPAATVYGEQAALRAATQPIGSSLKTASSARSLQPAGGQSSESAGVSDSSMPSGLRMLSAEPRAVASGAQEQARASDQPVELATSRSEALPTSRQPESIRVAVQERLHSPQQDEVALAAADTTSLAIAATQKDKAASQPEKTTPASQSLSSAERARLMTGRSEEIATPKQSTEQTSSRSEQTAQPEQSSEAAARAGVQDRATAQPGQHDAEREAQAAASKRPAERDIRTSSVAELEAIYNQPGPEDPPVESGSGGFRNDNDGRDGRGGWGGGGNEGSDGGRGDGGTGDRGDGNGGNYSWWARTKRDGSIGEFVKEYKNEHGKVIYAELYKKEEVFAFVDRDPVLWRYLQEEGILLKVPEHVLVDKIREAEARIQMAMQRLKDARVGFARSFDANRAWQSPDAMERYGFQYIRHANNLKGPHDDLSVAERKAGELMATTFAEAAQRQNWDPSRDDEFRAYKRGSVAEFLDNFGIDIENQDLFGMAGSLAAYTQSLSRDVRNNPVELQILIDVGREHNISMSGQERQAIQDATGGLAVPPELLEGAVNNLIDKIVTSNNWRTIIQQWNLRRIDAGTALGKNRRHNVDQILEFLKMTREAANKVLERRDAEYQNLVNTGKEILAHAHRTRALAQSERIANKQIAEAAKNRRVLLIIGFYQQLNSLMNQAVSASGNVALQAARIAG